MVGWLGVLFGFLVAPPQLYKIIATGQTQAISLVTYIFLMLAMTCYLIHAIHIRSKVFIAAQAINLTVNGIILALLLVR